MVQTYPDRNIKLSNVERERRLKNEQMVERMALTVVLCVGVHVIMAFHMWRYG